MNRKPFSIYDERVRVRDVAAGQEEARSAAVAPTLAHLALVLALLTKGAALALRHATCVRRVAARFAIETQANVARIARRFRGVARALGDRFWVDRVAFAVLACGATRYTGGEAARVEDNTVLVHHRVLVDVRVLDIDQAHGVVHDRAVEASLGVLEVGAVDVDLSLEEPIRLHRDRSADAVGRDRVGKGAFGQCSDRTL
mmetsp:Transcript_22488/g.52077  ORF Transcript_22488/g.52077 Transcript_22488/m.52077 type:complete len:200 (-) Transcript_22488:332-931(-)